jgi:hypothetical protein
MIKNKFVYPFAALLLVIVLATSLFAFQTANAAGACSCLVYFQNSHSLPPTGQSNFAAYRYGDWLSTYKGSYSSKGYNVSYVTPSTSGFGQLLLNGTAIVFNPGAFYADGTYGHIGYVTSASYSSSTKLWTIQYRDGNGWTTKNGAISLIQGLFTDSGCSNVAVRKLVTSSLSGVRFFNWSKK